MKRFRQLQLWIWLETGLEIQIWKSLPLNWQLNFLEESHPLRICLTNVTSTDNVDHVVQVLADQEMVILSEIVSHAAQMPRKVTEAKTEVAY